jgi:hypothetical protein
MTSLTLGGCGGSLYTDSRAAIWEGLWVSIINVVPIAGQNDPVLGEVIYEGKHDRGCQKGEERERGGDTDDT